MVECELTHLWSDIIHSKRLFVDPSCFPSILSMSSDHQVEDLTLKSPVTNSTLGFKLFKYVRTGSKFNKTVSYSLLDWLGVDRLSLKRYGGLQKKAHKLNIHLEYLHQILLLVKFLDKDANSSSFYVIWVVSSD